MAKRTGECRERQAERAAIDRLIAENQGEFDRLLARELALVECDSCGWKHSAGT